MYFNTSLALYKQMYMPKSNCFLFSKVFISILTFLVSSALFGQNNPIYEPPAKNVKFYDKNGRVNVKSKYKKNTSDTYNSGEYGPAQTYENHVDRSENFQSVPLERPKTFYHKDGLVNRGGDFKSVNVGADDGFQVYTKGMSTIKPKPVHKIRQPSNYDVADYKKESKTDIGTASKAQTIANNNREVSEEGFFTKSYNSFVNLFKKSDKGEIVSPR